MEPRELLEKYAGLVKTVRSDHRKQGFVGSHHDFLHALMVAHYAVMIAEDDFIAELAWLAGVCHNTDHIFPNLSEFEHRRQISDYLVHWTGLDSESSKKVLTAVMLHSKLNDPNDDQVTMTLKDADRLANLGPNVIIRSGQYYYRLPAFNPFFVAEFDPTSTYRNPKSVLRDIMSSLEWVDWLRLPKARELAKPYADFLQQFRALIQHQLREVGLDPYPFPEDYQE